MKVWPHWWYDDGTWDFDANTWDDDADEFEIPDEVVARYEAATEALRKASVAVGEALLAAGYKKHPWYKSKK